jgi:hypothetical protein
MSRAFVKLENKDGSMNLFQCFQFFLYTYVISKALPTALVWPVGLRNRSDFRDSCEPDFSKEQYVCIGRQRGLCSAKRSLEMGEETDWSQVSCGLMPQVQYRKFWEMYGWQVLRHPPYSPDMTTCSQN